MAKHLDITIENKLLAEERDMNIYHRSTRGAHIVSFDRAVTLALGLAPSGDYVHLSPVMGPGHLQGECIVSMPRCIDFELSAAGDATVSHAGDRIILKIPPGPPKWQIKMTQSRTFPGKQSSDRVIVGTGGSFKS